MGTYNKQFPELSTTSDLALLFTLESERLHQPSQVEQFTKSDDPFPAAQDDPQRRENRTGVAVLVYSTSEALEWFKHREAARERKAQERAEREAKAASTAQERARKARERAEKAMERARAIEQKYGIASENGTPAETEQSDEVSDESEAETVNA